MSAPEIEPEDVAAMRREDPDGWRRYMRQQITNGRSRRDTVPTPTPPPPPPGHRPGAWPTGSSPPGPPPEWSIPKPVWDAAVRHYRNEEHRPDQPCDCGNCP